MKNTELAYKLKQLRKIKGYSQEEVAGKAQLSLRTVQRIENGETEPRGDTLHRMAKVLGVDFEIFTNTENPTSKNLPIILNLSALICIAFPFLGIIVPLLIWELKKEKDQYLNDTGKKLINFQLTWCLIISFYYLILFSIDYFHINFPLPTFDNIGRIEVFVILPNYIYRVTNAIFILINAYRSYYRKKVFYKPAIPFLR